MEKKVRKNFVELVKAETNNRKSFTENGAVAYETSGKALLDFNFKLSQFRHMPEDEIMDAFTKVFFEDPMVATKFVFYVGDVREGLGERKVFRTCIKWLAQNKPEVAKSVLRLIAEYTRWDNLVILVDEPSVAGNVLDIIAVQLSEDIGNLKEGKPISLLAKWMPSENTSSKQTRAKASVVRKGLGLSSRDYRKILSELRAYLNVVEVKTSANNWTEIDYEAVPSKANLKYAGAFLRHDPAGRTHYLNSLRKGDTKINAGVLQPHEIVSGYCAGWWGGEPKPHDETLEQLWKNLPNVQVNDTLVVRDGSGSMSSTYGPTQVTCLDVATALAIYTSEHNSDTWKDKFITFSRNPKFVDLSNCKSLRDKLKVCEAEDECSNTDIEATMMLILRTAINNALLQEELPANVLIISDMQFDAGRALSRYSGFNWDETLFEQIAKEYEKHGYKLPKLIFWNVSDRNANTIPMQANELGLILCSGFAVTTLKMLMSGEVDPYKVLLEQINAKRYDPVEKAYLEATKK